MTVRYSIRNPKLDAWKRLIGARLLDQVAWSGAFFSFNFAATIVLVASDFALLAVITSVVFMAIAVARAWAIGSRIVVATKFRLAVADALDGRHMAWTSAFIGLFVAGGVWLIAGRSATGDLILQMVLLSLALVVADMPRQGLIFSGRHKSSLIVSATYAGFGVVALVLASVMHSSPMWPWIMTSLVCAGLGWTLRARAAGGMRQLPVKEARSHAWRITAESLYTSIASQLGLLMLFWLTDHDATAGYRLSYALVFAPAFMLLQGISPLLTVQFAGEIARKGTASLKTWFVGPVVSVAAATLCGVAGWFASEYLPVPDLFRSVVPFLIPVGLSLAGSQVLEFFLTGIRYSASEHVMHRLRIVVVTVDVAAQAAGIWFGGVDGLIMVLIVLAAFKLLAGLLIGVAVASGGSGRHL